MPTEHVYAATDLPKSIPDAGPGPGGSFSGGPPGVTVSSITVPHAITIDDLDVEVSITHPFTADLRITLIAPNSATCVLKQNGSGGSGDNLTQTIFDAAAQFPVAEGVAPFTGRHRPVGDLTSFYNIAANGVWQLQVEDVTNRDTGTLTDFKLRITGENVIAPTAAVTVESSLVRRGKTSAVTFTLDAESTTFSRRSVITVGGTLRDFAGSGMNYTATFVPEANFKGNAQIIVPAKAFTNSTGLVNTAELRALVQVDTTARPCTNPYPDCPPGTGKEECARLGYRNVCTTTVGPLPPGSGCTNPYPDCPPGLGKEECAQLGYRNVCTSTVGPLPGGEIPCNPYPDCPSGTGKEECAQLGYRRVSCPDESPLPFPPPNDPAPTKPPRGKGCTTCTGGVR
jgi:subtilisin-like proprotein convertase family protein